MNKNNALLRIEGVLWASRIDQTALNPEGTYSIGVNKYNDIANKILELWGNQHYISDPVRTNSEGAMIGYHRTEAQRFNEEREEFFRKICINILKINPTVATPKAHIIRMINTITDILTTSECDPNGN